MNDLLKFIKKSLTAFHAVKEIEGILASNGYKKLQENMPWKLNPGDKCYVTRNSSAIIAFNIPNKAFNSFNISAAHLDSPTFKLKPNFKLDKARYSMLNTEIYGGPILNTWMDRPLDICGRVIVKKDNVLETHLVSFDKPMAIIPNCSIHYYPELNKGVALNPQNDLVPLFSCKNDVDLIELIANKLGVLKENIVSHDLYLSLIDRGSVGGANNELILAPQIDNLECAYACCKALINSTPSNSVNICALFDNEEIGSRTRQGAASTMLSDVLERISISFGKSNEEHKIALANSFIVSADNAHAFHPNYPQKYDLSNAVHLNEGIVIKTAARGSYTTDAMSSAYFKTICEMANVKYQLNANRSDIPGGSTLGCISLNNVSIHSVDIGLGQLAMHSAYETAGVLDLEYMVKALTVFYNLHLEVNEDGKLAF